MVAGKAMGGFAALGCSPRPAEKGRRKSRLDGSVWYEKKRVKGRWRF